MKGTTTMQPPTELHCYRPRSIMSDCDATLTMQLRESIRRRRVEVRIERIERKYDGRRAKVWRELEKRRREIARETSEEIREAINAEMDGR